MLRDPGEVFLLRHTGGEVGAQPVGVVAEHDVERAVGVGGEPSRPGRPARQVGRAGERLECDRIDALHPRHRRRGFG
ncbi:MAG: hypothetical protein ACKOOG_00330, partial [Actinomycetota bacterium]